MMKYELELYVVGRSLKSETAIDNLRRVCERWLPGRHEISVIDVLEDPLAAEEANVIATPTLIRKVPPPPRRIVGDLSAADVLLSGLGIDTDGRASWERNDG
jgi:circadian clock protein KaiB